MRARGRWGGWRGRCWRRRGGLLIRGRASPGGWWGRRRIPEMSINFTNGTACGRREGGHTPFTRSKIIRIATQNSSKSKFPSLSTSARSQTRSSWSSRSWLFLSTEAAWAPVRYLPPPARGEKISQYFSTSACSIRLFDIAHC